MSVDSLASSILAVPGEVADLGEDFWLEFISSMLSVPVFPNLSIVNNKWF